MTSRGQLGYLHVHPGRCDPCPSSTGPSSKGTITHIPQIAIGFSLIRVWVVLVARSLCRCPRAWFRPLGSSLVFALSWFLHFGFSLSVSSPWFFKIGFSLLFSPAWFLPIGFSLLVSPSWFLPLGVFLLVSPCWSSRLFFVLSPHASPFSYLPLVSSVFVSLDWFLQTSLACM